MTPFESFVLGFICGAAGFLAGWAVGRARARRDFERIFRAKDEAFKFWADNLLMQSSPRTFAPFEPYPEPAWPRNDSAHAAIIALLIVLLVSGTLNRKD